MRAGLNPAAAVRAGDGYKGWPEAAPFDAIIVTCAPEKVPPPLIEQLKDGGRMIIPVGPAWDQELVLLRKQGDRLERHAVLPVRFVPMTGQSQGPEVPKPEAGARCGRRARFLERWQAAGHHRHDALSFLLGAAVVVAGDGAGLCHQLGMCLSLGGVVCTMGAGPSQTGRCRVHQRGRDSLGQKQTGEHFLSWN